MQLNIKAPLFFVFAVLRFSWNCFCFLLPSFLLRPTPIARHVPSFALVLLLLLLHVLLFICYMKNKNYNSFLFSLFSFCFLPSNGIFQKNFSKNVLIKLKICCFFFLSVKIQPKGSTRTAATEWLELLSRFLLFLHQYLDFFFLSCKQHKQRLFILSFHYRYSYARLLSALTHTQTQHSVPRFHPTDLNAHDSTPLQFSRPVTNKHTNQSEMMRYDK